MLAPGDTLVSKFRSTSWTTALVISIDHGELGKDPWDRARPAQVLLLVNGPTLIRRDFTWIFRNYDKVGRYSEVP